MNSSRSLLQIGFLLCAVLFSLQIIPRWWSDSIILDEEWELTASYYYWKTGDVWTPCGTPGPGALCALPLLALDLKLDPTRPADYPNRSLGFLFLDNWDHLTAITVWSRSVHWILGLLVGCLLFYLVRDAPLIEGVAALVLWAFDPTLLAYCGTAKADVALLFWFFLCLVCYSRIQSKGKIASFALVGFLAGFAAAARYNGLLILPIVGILEIFYWADSGGGWNKLANRVPQWLAGFAGFLCAISLVYLPGTILGKNHPWPIVFYLNYLDFYTSWRGGMSNSLTYFAGRYWANSSFFYFPYHFFFKTPVPFFSLLGLALLGGLGRKISFPRWLWVPPVIYMAVYFIGDKNMTLRHTLPIFPFLILIAAKAFQWLWKSCRASSSALVRACPVLLLCWQPLSVLYNFPHHIAYANDFMTTEQKASCLHSPHWNLGQDMKRLAELGKKRGWKKVKLMTPQRTDPYFYGLNWENWTHRDLDQPQPGTVYVVDSSIQDNLEYEAYLTRQCPWIGNLPSTGNIGGTLYYYEIPGNPNSVPKDDTKPIISFPYYLKDPPYRTTPTPAT